MNEKQSSEWKKLLGGVKNNTLKKLELYLYEGKGLGGWGLFSELLAALESNTSIESLQLGENALYGDRITNLITILQKNTSIRILDLNFNKIDAVTLKKLADMLSENKTLQVLNLKSVFEESLDTKSKVEIAKALANALKRNDRLQEIDLSHNGIGPEEAGIIATGLLENQSVTKLNLHGNSIGDDGAKELAKVLKKNTGLEWLQLDDNHIGDDGAIAIAEALEYNYKLSELLLCASTTKKIAKKGALAFQKCLLKNTALKTLVLAYHRVGDDGAQILSEAIEKNHFLTSINLAANGISSSGAVALAKVLEVNQVMQSIALGNSHLYTNDDEGFVALAKMLKKNSVITSLYLEGNQIGAKGIKAFKEALSENHSVEHLVLRSGDQAFESFIESKLVENRMRANFLQNILQDVRTNKYNLLTLSKIKKIESKNIQSLSGHSSNIECMTLLPNGQVISGSSDCTLKVWDIATGKTLNTLSGHDCSPPSHSGYVTSVVVLPDGRVVSGSNDGTLKVWNLSKPQGQECVQTLQDNNQGIRGVAVLPNGLVISGHKDGALKAWDVGTGKCVRALQQAHGDTVGSIALLPNGQVITGASDKMLKIWDFSKPQGQECIQTLQEHEAHISSIVVLPNGKVVSGSYDKTIKLWDVATGQCLNTLHGHTDIVTSIAALSKDHVISGSRDGTLKMWDVSTGQCLSTLQENSGVWSVMVLPNGKIISGAFETLKIWELQNINISPQEKSDLLKIISENTSLKSLNLSYIHLNELPQGLENLKKILENHPILTMVDLSHTDLTDEIFLELLPSIVKINKLRKLSITINSNQLSEKTKILGCRFLSHNKDINEKLKMELEAYKEDLKKHLNAPNPNILFNYGRIFQPSNYKAIHLAAWYGDKEFLELLFSIPEINVNEKTPLEETLLHCAVVNNQREIVDFLVEKKFDVNACNVNLETPLHYAAKYGHSCLAPFLIEQGAEYSLTNKEGKTPADIVRKEEHVNLSHYLYTLEMQKICETDNIEGAKRLINVLGHDIKNIKDEAGNNILLMALSKKNAKLIKYLLEETNPKTRNELVESKNNNGDGVLHLSAAISDSRFLNHLLHNFNHLPINDKNHDGLTPLHLSILHKLPKNVKTLLAYGGDIVIRADFKFGNEVSKQLNGVELGVVMGDISVLKTINAHKLSRLHIGAKLLWLAVKHNQIPVLKYLLETFRHFKEEAQRNKLFDSENISLINYAAKLGGNEIIMLLHKSYKIPLSSAQPMGKNALHFAIEGKQLETVKLLIKLDKNLLPSLFKNEKGIVVNAIQQAEEFYKNTHEENYKGISTFLEICLANPACSNSAIFTQELVPENLVFEGGGARDIAHVGAIKALEKSLIQQKRSMKDIRRVAGTSAGSIAATLLAVGYQPTEIETILKEKNLMDFLDFDNVKIYKDMQGIDITDWKSALKQYAGCVYESKGFNPLNCFSDYMKKSIKSTVKTVYNHRGLCSGESFLTWIEEKIEAKTGKKHLTLGELKRLSEKEPEKYKNLHIVTVKLGENGTEGRVFSSEDSTHSTLIISDLTRCSMSIPGVFQPHHLYTKQEAVGKVERRIFAENEHYIDGGVFLNYPLEVFDYQKYQSGRGDGNFPMYNSHTLGFALVDANNECATDKEKDTSMLNTLLSAIKNKLFTNDENIINLAADLLKSYYQSEAIARSFKPRDSYDLRTVSIDSLGKSTLDFSMSAKEQQKLIESGEKAVNTFFEPFISRTTLPDFIQNDNSDPTTYSQVPVFANGPEEIGSNPLPGIEVVYDHSGRGNSVMQQAVSFQAVKKVSCFFHNAFSVSSFHQATQQMPNDILFDQGAWDSEMDIHPTTGEPIFNYRVYKAGVEVGSMSFYKHPLLCRSEEGDRHNIISLRGVFAGYDVEGELQTVEDICAALPPTLLEQLTSTAYKGSQQGVIRGMANVIGYALDVRGFSKRVSQCTHAVVYYGGVFTLQYVNYYSLLASQNMPEAQKITTAAYQAMWNTGSLVLTHTVLNLGCQLAGWMGEKARENGWNSTGGALQSLASYGGYGAYAYQSYTQGPLSAMVSIAVGTVVEKTVEIPGRYVVGRFFQPKADVIATNQGSPANAGGTNTIGGGMPVAVGR